MTEVLVLGASGMLGSMVAAVLGADPGLRVTSSSRRPAAGGVAFDIEADPLDALLDSGSYDWVVNAAGVVKPLIDERDPASVASAEAVNAEFPHRLRRALAESGAGLVHISTDGVFSGRAGPYGEDDPHDATGVYEETKSRGEVEGPAVQTLRCSVIGPESPPPRSLLGWALARPRGAEITGYADQRWNGVTTLHLARLCGALVTGGAEALPSPLHVVPGDSVSKAELLELALRAHVRDDVVVVPGPGPQPADRTLRTRHPEANRRLWAAAGYDEPPAIAAMLAELAAHDAPGR